MWKFPTTSETFVRREIQALESRGIRVSVISEYRPDGEADQAALADWTKSTFYARPVRRSEMKRAFRSVLRRRPWRVLQLYVFTIGHRYHEKKSFQYDHEVFLYTCYVSEIVRRSGAAHVHTPWADLQAFITSGIAALLDIPYSLNARAHDIHRYSYRYGFEEKFARAKFIVTNSQYNKAYLSRYLSPSTLERIRVVYNGLPLKLYTRGVRHQPSNPVRFLCVARLIEEKGLVHLLDACVLLKAMGIDFTVNIAGGPEEPRCTDYHLALKAKHRELGLERQVHFLGAVAQRVVLEELHASDVFVLPCVKARDGGNDISPNSLLEAMAVGLPVISTTITAIPEIVDSGRDGLLVPPGDAEALSHAMQCLAESPEMRRRLGEAAREKIRTRFDVSKNIEVYVNLFRQTQP